MAIKSSYAKSILILSAFLAAMVVFGGNGAVDAIDPNVIFETNPLFNEANFLPGQSVSHWIKVKNTTDSPRAAAARVSAFSDPDVLGGQLDLTIKRGATVLYAKTLTDFFSGDEVILSTVNPGETVQYDFTVVFKAPADNAYMLKLLNFDILVGFVDS